MLVLVLRGAHRSLRPRDPWPVPQRPKAEETHALFFVFFFKAVVGHMTLSYEEGPGTCDKGVCFLGSRVLASGAVA